MLIPVESLLSDSHFPIQIALLAGSDLVTNLRLLSEEVGWGDDAVSVCPWVALDDWDKRCIEKYDGFDLTMVNGYRVVISVTDMYYYMCLASKIYIERHPEAMSELQTIQENYRKHFGLNEHGEEPHA